MDIKIHEVIDELTYRSYAYNRQRTPEITPESWGKIYPNVEMMETRFQGDYGSNR